MKWVIQMKYALSAPPPQEKKPQKCSLRHHIVIWGTGLTTFNLQGTSSLLCVLVACMYNSVTFIFWLNKFANSLRTGYILCQKSMKSSNMCVAGNFYYFKDHFQYYLVDYPICFFWNIPHFTANLTIHLKPWVSNCMCVHAHMHVRVWAQISGIKTADSYPGYRFLSSS